MTSNGILIFVVLFSISILISFNHLIPTTCTITLLAFILANNSKSILESIKYAFIAVFPISVMLITMWVFIIGYPPYTFGSQYVGGYYGALLYVIGLTFRLFIFVLLIHSSISLKIKSNPILFVRELSLPHSVKQTILVTLSIASTIINSKERAWVALVASNIVTPRRSMKNIRHSWIFLQTIWIFMLSTINERLEGKWKIESLEVMMKEVLKKQKLILSKTDIIFFIISIINLISTYYF